MPVAKRHFVNGNPLTGEFPAHLEQAMFGLGCFWGAERCFWQLPGVYSTAVGYAAGETPNPTYEEVCSGLTSHNEVVRVIFDPAQIRSIVCIPVPLEQRDHRLFVSIKRHVRVKVSDEGVLSGASNLGDFGGNRSARHREGR